MATAQLGTNCGTLMRILFIKNRGLGIFVPFICTECKAWVLSERHERKLFRAIIFSVSSKAKCSWRPPITSRRVHLHRLYRQRTEVVTSDCVSQDRVRDRWDWCPDLCTIGSFLPAPATPQTWTRSAMCVSPGSISPGAGPGAPGTSHPTSGFWWTLGFRRR